MYILYFTKHRPNKVASPHQNITCIPSWYKLYLQHLPTSGFLIWRHQRDSEFLKGLLSLFGVIYLINFDPPPPSGRLHLWAFQCSRVSSLRKSSLTYPVPRYCRTAIMRIQSSKNREEQNPLDGFRPSFWSSVAGNPIWGVPSLAAILLHPRTGQSVFSIMQTGWGWAFQSIQSTYPVYVSSLRIQSYVY